MIAAKRNMCTGSCNPGSTQNFQMHQDHGRAQSFCKYGHQPIDNDCSTPCEGVRYAPCRCQTEEEATSGNQSNALEGIGICAGLLAAGVLVIVWMRKRAAARRSTTSDVAMADAPRSDTEDGVVPAQVVQAQEVQVVGASTEEDNNKTNESDDPQLTKSTSRIEIVTESSGRLAQANPRKFNAIRLLVPLTVIGFIGYGFWQMFDNADKWYETWSYFAGFCLGTWTVIVIIGTLVQRLLGFGSALYFNNPMLLVNLVMRRIVLGTPVILLAAVGHGVHKYVAAGQWYHAECSED